MRRRQLNGAGAGQANAGLRGPCHQAHTLSRKVRSREVVMAASTGLPRSCTR